MKKVFLVMLACVVLIAGASALPAKGSSFPATPQEANPKSETQSPELLEAEKLNAEALALYKAGKFDEAALLAKRVLQIREPLLAANHDLIISALINLGEIDRARRKYGEARIYFQRILTIYEQSPMPDPAAISNLLDILAFLNYLQGNYGEAEKMYLRSLALREQASVPDQLQVATSLYNLAEFYRLRGEYKKAVPLYQRSIEIKGSALGADDKEVGKALEHYACLYHATNQTEKWKEVRSQFSFLRQKDEDAGKIEILNGKAVSLPIPSYPRGAMGGRFTGVVIVKVTIDEQGKVIEARDMCGANPYLADASVQAAYKAKFTPTLREGTPVKVTGVITYRFVARY